MTDGTTRWFHGRSALLAGLLAGGVIVVMALAGGVSWSALRAPGTPGVWTSGQFRLFAIVAMMAAVVLAGAVGVMMRRRPWRRRPGAQDGTAIIEFALLLPVILMISLLMIQSSLLMGGYLCVNYASYCAARSAIVQIPRDRSDATVAEPPNTLAVLSANGYTDTETKIERIYASALWAVLPTGDSGFAGQSPYADRLAEGLGELYAQYGRPGPAWIDAKLPGKSGYVERHTTVTIDDVIEGVPIAAHADVKVTVTHDLYLSIPYADWMLTRLDSEHAVDLGEGKWALRVSIPCMLPNEGVDDRIEIVD